VERMNGWYHVDFREVGDEAAPDFQSRRARTVVR
jgi:hypothetical protein